uniref:phosphoserine phosphatase n=1 Tax=Entamoeba invadens TaxID=33085 RepID=S0B0L3_ENTIV|nr:phosphoserine phosphatase, putative [Entamoeba invadens]
MTATPTTDETQLTLIRITGEDKPGVTATLTQVLADHDAFIMDIGQADIHKTLCLGILFKALPSSHAEIMKELLLKAYQLGVNLKFSPVTKEDYTNWVAQQGKNRYIVTLIGRELTAKQFTEVTKVIASQKLNIDMIQRLSGRIPLEESERSSRSCVEFSVRGTPSDLSAIQSKFIELAATLGIDISFQFDDMYRRSRRLICFDMDSTLIETEVIDELADRAGVGKQVREITESAMRGEIDFCESFTKRVALLEGLDVSVMQEIAEKLPVSEGLERLMKILKLVGFKVAILSGGFTYFGNYLKDKYGMDYVFAIELEIKAGKLTGKYVGDIVDGRKKAELLKLLAQIEHVNIAQTIAVGDGANDFPMLGVAGLGIAYHANPKVKKNGKQALSNVGIDGILYFLGFKDFYVDVEL